MSLSSLSRLSLAACVLSGSLTSILPPAAAETPVTLRIAGLPVTPAHMPAAKIWVKNQTDQDYQGTLQLELPDGWRTTPVEQAVMLAPDEAKAFAFTIRDGKNQTDNRYTLTAVVSGQGGVVRHQQEIACCSAPYFKPEIDAQSEDWKDAIPVTFATQSKNTTISTFWNRRQFSMLVAVEEDALTPADAVQIAISPQKTQTPADSDGTVSRYEFLLTADGAGQGGLAFQLAEPGATAAATQPQRPLNDLEMEDPKLAVWHKDGTTYYEWGISFRSLPDIRPSEGREFFLSVLVHDPDGTGLRDLGQAVGLWPSQRNRLAWSHWPGAQWPQDAPMDNKIEWGMCSSKY